MPFDLFLGDEWVGGIVLGGGGGGGGRRGELFGLVCTVFIDIYRSNLKLLLSVQWSD